MQHGEKCGLVAFGAALVAAVLGPLSGCTRSSDDGHRAEQATPAASTTAAADKPLTAVAAKPAEEERPFPGPLTVPEKWKTLPPPSATPTTTATTAGADLSWLKTSAAPRVGDQISSGSAGKAPTAITPVLALGGTSSTAPARNRPLSAKAQAADPLLQPTQVPASDVSPKTLAPAGAETPAPTVPRNPLREGSGAVPYVPGPFTVPEPATTPPAPSPPAPSPPAPSPPAPTPPTAVVPASPPVVGADPVKNSVAPKPASTAKVEPPPKKGPGGVPPTAKHSKIPFDPIKENGAIFEGWPTPKTALVISGRQDGYLEPCGCAGLDRMKGGISRRYSMFKMLRDKGWNVVGLDVGGIAKGFGKQAELKFQFAVDAMKSMKYDAITLGTADLQLPTEEVMASVTTIAGQKQESPFVCGNDGLFQFDQTMLPRFKVLTTPHKKIGVTAVLGKAQQQQLQNGNIVLVDTDVFLDKAVPLLKQRGAEFLVLLAYASKQEATRLAQKYPDFDLVVVSEGTAEPPADAEKVPQTSKTRLIQVGEKGMYAVVLGLYDDPSRPMRYQRVTLDARFPPSDKMHHVMAAYQDQLQRLGLAGLGVRPLPHPLAATNGKFVGSEACQSCHEESYRVWKKTPHSRAFASLVTANPPRHYDPECISCHVVGWNPQKFFPYVSSYESEKKTPHLRNVGCEDCHGPGEMHCKAENGADQKAIDLGRLMVRLTKAEAADPNCKKQNCWSCHDLDNSPDFAHLGFDVYWPYVEHHEKE